MIYHIVFQHLTKVIRGLPAFLALFWLTACGTADTHSSHAYTTHTLVASEEDDDDDDDMPFVQAATKRTDIATVAKKEKDDDDDDSFEMADNISDTRLATMRGGFVTVGGLNINFGFSTTTMVNGVVQSSLVLSSDNLSGSIPKNLQQIIQSGSGNQYISQSALGNTVVTVVQNTLNNAVIQNTNTLTVSVGNLNSYRNEMALINSQMWARH